MPPLWLVFQPAFVSRKGTLFTNMSSDQYQPNETQHITCPQCHAQMPREMRFCRQCGYRLGEGVAEYTETVRLNKTMNRPFPPSATEIREAASLAQQQTGHAPYAPGQFVNAAMQLRRRHTPAKPWLVPVFLLAFFAAGGGLFTALNSHSNSSSAPHVTIRQTRQQSYLGDDDFSEADGGGALVKSAEPAGSPLDKAGLTGGDIIKQFNHQAVGDEGDLSNLLKKAPVGHPTDVTYLRDGEMRQATLVPIAKDEIERLSDAARVPDGARGVLGVDDLERVIVPGTPLHGVQLGDVSKNAPADLAGLHEDDILIEFNGAPIRTETELRHRIARSTPGSNVPIVVMRDGKRLEIPVKMGRD